ncbi:hypothetical protein BCR44DRAFT_34174 [Catenaria anguillulae PL171]|uniref:Tetratricopeptide repeat-domain-containing protein n=1 Tax=Catenaria anguillulae PL171 TaxID=765915 RepID=A0A1Y2HL87_9FUNG|nr:hypothetical protein BCR44DRAFT_34174 [Catenaria anguillulae PL171]
MQCHRILATTHFRLGNLAQGLALLRRYIELGSSAQQRAVKSFPPWIFPELHASMIELYEQIGCAKDSMFSIRDDGIDEFASLLVEGSQRLAENDELSEALDIARKAYHLISRFPTISQETTHAILVNLATLLGISALSTFESSKRTSQQIEAQHLLQDALGMNSNSATAHYELGLIYADRGELSAAKMHAKQALKLNKAHIAAWHLLVLVLTAARDLDGAIKMAELGIRESVASLVPTAPQLVPVIDTKTGGGIAKSNTFDALAALARDQTLNNTWAPAEYDLIVAAVFDLRLAQIRVVEQTRGAEAAVAMVQELFRWYKLVFDQDVLNPAAATTAIMAAAMTRRPGSSSVSGGIASPNGAPTSDDSRGRSESVRSTASTWSLSASPGTGALSLRVKQRNRKRTMLTAALANATVSESGNGAEGGASGVPSGSSSPNRRASVGDNRPRGQSAASVTSLAVSEAGSNGPDSSIAAGPSISRTETLAKLWLCLSHILLNNGQLHEAASLLQEAYDLPTRDPWLEGELAALDYALGNTDAALNRWHRLLARNPHHIGALIGIARAQVDAGHLEDAELLLDDLTQHAGQMSVDAWYLFGRVCKAQQQPERALACFKRALELERSEPIQDFARAPRLSLVMML